MPVVKGRVIEVPVEPNAPMKQGDVLFKIDPRPYQYVVDQKKALLAEAEKMKVEVEPIAGGEVQTMVAQLFAMPARIVERAKQALIYKQR